MSMCANDALDIGGRRVVVIQRICASAERVSHSTDKTRPRAMGTPVSRRGSTVERATADFLIVSAVDRCCMVHVAACDGANSAHRENPVPRRGMSCYVIAIAQILIATTSFPHRRMKVARTFQVPLSVHPEA